MVLTSLSQSIIRVSSLGLCVVSIPENILPEGAEPWFGVKFGVLAG